jgi:DNA-binding NarL/FixJ family response regulator
MDADLVAGSVALERAVAADNEFWRHPRSGRAQQQARDAAILQALAAGVSVEYVADKLGVLISDVERMAKNVGHPQPGAAT